jgi:hypothetical protein
MTASRQRLTHTPFLDGWRATLASATAARGQKAELARHLAASRGTSPQVAANLVHRITSGRILPNGEDVLEISHWMASRTICPSARGDTILYSKSPPSTSPAAKLG